MFELVFLSGARAGAVMSLPSRAMAGRSPDCEVEVPDPNVSRRHGRFEFDGTTLRLIDNGSSNGCFVNEQRISDAIIGHGDMVRFGETRIRVQRRTARGSGSSSDDAHSSVFGFNDTGADLSHSISMSMISPPAAISSQLNDLSARLNLVLWVSEQLASIKTLNDLYGPVLDLLFEVFPQVERGFLMLGGEYDQLVPQAMRTRSGEQTENLAVSSSLCREALRKKEILTYSDTGNTDFDQGMSLVSLNIRSAMVVPLMVKDEILGLLVVDTSDRRRSFSQSDMEIAAAVCRQIAVGIKYTMVLSDLERETRTRSNLSRFLPRPVVDQAVSGNIDLRLGGSTCRGTIFFADVIGFTRLSEAMSPEAVIGMMNSFFNRMVPAIEGEMGAIDKFMGDCIMAFWGIPFDQGESSLRAVGAGLMMQNILCGLNSSRAAKGEPQLAMGVGLEAGEVVAGNIGSEDRVEYTVLGNIVNTAQRIQSCACRGQVLVGDGVWRELGSVAVGIRLPAVSAKNKAEPVQVVSVRGVKREKEVLLHIPVWVAGVEAVLTRRLSSDNFVLLHESSLDPDGQQVVSRMIECPDLDFGVARVTARLPGQDSDGSLVRSQILLSDRSLGGLIADGDGTAHKVSCELTWGDMQRGIEVTEASEISENSKASMS